MKKNPVKKIHKRLKKTRSPKSNYNFITIPALIILVLGVISYLAISTLPMFKPTKIGINEVSVGATGVNLYFPTTISANPGSETTIDLTINTGSAKVSAVQVELTYDQTKLTTPTLIQGDFLTEKLGSPSVKNGLITFVYTAPLGSDGKSGTGKLATLKFTPKTGNSELAFTKNTMVAAVGVNSNVLQSATGSSIVLSSSSPQDVVKAPPVLKEVAPAPALAKPTSTTEPTPSYLPEHDFDYNAKPSIVSENQAVPDESTSSFSRFIAWIKLLFNSQNK